MTQEIPAISEAEAILAKDRDGANGFRTIEIAAVYARSIKRTMLIISAEEMEGVQEHLSYFDPEERFVDLSSPIEEIRDEEKVKIRMNYWEVNSIGRFWLGHAYVNAGDNKAMDLLMLDWNFFYVLNEAFVNAGGIDNQELSGYFEELGAKIKKQRSLQ